MKYEVDQSGKVEDTAKHTVIAYSNSEEKAIVIPKKVKRQIQEVFRSSGMIRLYIYYVFAIGIYYLIKDFKKAQLITIDLEYQGKDKIIDEIIDKFLKSYDRPAHQIHFKRIGSHPRVHYAAKNVFDKKKKAQYIVSLEDILKLIKKTDGRLRECLSTLVGAQPRSSKLNVTKKVQKVKSKN